MELPRYRSQVGGAGARQIVAPTPEQTQRPRKYDGVFEFSQALSNLGGTLANIAVDQTRRMRDTQMRKEVAEGRTAYRQFKAGVIENYFSPATARQINPESEKENYLHGYENLGQMSDEFLAEIGKNFSYEESYQQFLQMYNEDLEGFRHQLHQKQQNLWMEDAVSGWEANVANAVRDYDREGLMQLMEDGVASGFMNPSQAQNMGNEKLKQMYLDQAQNEARSMIWSEGPPESREEIFRRIEKTVQGGWQDMNGERQFLNPREVDQLFSRATQEHTARIAEENQVQKERADEAHSQFERMFNTPGASTADMRRKLRDEQHEVFGHMDTQHRIFWHNQLDGIEQAQAREAAGDGADDISGGIITDIHTRIASGAYDVMEIDNLLLHYLNVDLIDEPTFRRLRGDNHSRNELNILKGGHDIINSMGRQLGMGPTEITMAKEEFRDQLMNNNYLTESEDGRLQVSRDLSPEQMLTIARNMMLNTDWGDLAERLNSREYARSTFGSERRFDVGEKVQWMIDDMQLLGMDLDRKMIESLNRLQAGQQDLVTNYINENRYVKATRDNQTGRIVHTLDTGSATGNIDLTFMIEPLERDEEGNITRARERVFIYDRRRDEFIETSFDALKEEWPALALPTAQRAAPVEAERRLGERLGELVRTHEEGFAHGTQGDERSLGGIIVDGVGRAFFGTGDRTGTTETRTEQQLEVQGRDRSGGTTRRR